MSKSIGVTARNIGIGLVAGIILGGTGASHASSETPPVPKTQHGVGCFMPAPNVRVNYGYDLENDSDAPMDVTVTVQVTNPRRVVSSASYVSLVQPGEKIDGTGSYYRTKRHDRRVTVTFDAQSLRIVDSCGL